MAGIDHKANRIVALQESQADAQARERLLQSLKFPGFNERRNQVKEPFDTTLEWIFAGDNNYDSDEDTDSISSDSSSADLETGEDGLHQGDSDNGSDSQPRRSTDLMESGDRSLQHTPKSSSDYSQNSARDDSIDSESRASDVSTGYRSSHQGFGDVSGIKWPSFSNWLKSTDVIYWISGKPGSGKTTLVKYILGHEQTRKDLDVWSPGCVIVSHFFWRPGASMQKNLKGLFCSLLYQLLESSDAALRQVRSSISQRKDSHTDWSVAELHSALQRAMDGCASGVCLFLDGIDEIQPEHGTEPGIPDFLEWALKLSEREKIKLCLASRPESQILEELSRYPWLRLQDLNRQDLMAYAKSHVKLPEQSFTGEHEGEERVSEAEIIYSLVNKAEGVFLWLVLATRSVNEGVRQGDNAHILQKRIDRLPPDLYSLYKDMWERTSASSLSDHRAIAALYFKVLLTGTSAGVRGLSILELTLATTFLGDQLSDALANHSKVVSRGILLRECQNVENKLKNHCVGLIELQPGNSSRDFKSWYGREYDIVSRLYHNSGLQFIHRTARDFLLDTDSGRKMRSFDTTSQYCIEYLILKAKILSTDLCVDGISYLMIEYPLVHFWETWKDTDQWASKDWERLLLLVESLAISGKLWIECFEQTEGSGPHAVAYDHIHFWCFVLEKHLDDNFVMSKVRTTRLSRNAKSEILLYLCKGRWFYLGRRLPLCQKLIKEGADPNWKGWARAESRHVFNEAGDDAIALTPWQRILLKAFVLFAGFTFKPELSELACMMEIMLLLNHSGADLGETINMAIPCSGLEHFDEPWELQPAKYFITPDKPSELVVSIPAHIITRLVTTFVRTHSSWLGEGVLDEKLLHFCLSLEQACAEYPGNKECQVLGLIKTTQAMDGEITSLDWYEATETVQTQFGSRLMKSMDRWFGSRESHIEDEFSSRVELKDFAVETAVLSIFKDESWTLKGCGMEFISAQLEKLGLTLATIDQATGGRPLPKWASRLSVITELLSYQIRQLEARLIQVARVASTDEN